MNRLVSSQNDRSPRMGGLVRTRRLVLLLASLALGTTSCVKTRNTASTWSDLRSESDLGDSSVGRAIVERVFWDYPGPPWKSVEHPDTSAEKLWHDLSLDDRFAVLRISPEQRVINLLRRVCLASEAFWVKHGASYSPTLEELGQDSFVEYLRIVFGELPYELNYCSTGSGYSLSATPTAAGLRHFFVDQTGVVRFELDKPATARSRAVD